MIAAIKKTSGTKIQKNKNNKKMNVAILVSELFRIYVLHYDVRRVEFLAFLMEPRVFFSFRVAATTTA